mmetsp:Transcript_22204/g.42152  ORF Transcript_22204/g.42152 Transcript_22204/m.42152 type:complete len:229 (+) Transcript_22204:3424-4110(+)
MLMGGASRGTAVVKGIVSHGRRGSILNNGFLEQGPILACLGRIAMIRRNFGSCRGHVVYSIGRPRATTASFARGGRDEWLKFVGCRRSITPKQEIQVLCQGIGRSILHLWCLWLLRFHGWRGRHVGRGCGGSQVAIAGQIRSRQVFQGTRSGTILLMHIFQGTGQTIECLFHGLLTTMLVIVHGLQVPKGSSRRGGWWHCRQWKFDKVGIPNGIHHRCRVRGCRRNYL